MADASAKEAPSNQTANFSFFLLHFYIKIHLNTHLYKQLQDHFGYLVKEGITIIFSKDLLISSYTIAFLTGLGSFGAYLFKFN